MQTSTSGEGKFTTIKVFASEKIYEKHSNEPGIIISDNKSEIKICVNDGYINLTDIQLQGKKWMPVKDLLNGFDIEPYL